MGLLRGLKVWCWGTSSTAPPLSNFHPWGDPADWIMLLCPLHWVHRASQDHTGMAYSCQAWSWVGLAWRPIAWSWCIYPVPVHGARQSRVGPQIPMLVHGDGGSVGPQELIPVHEAWYQPVRVRWSIQGWAEAAGNPGMWGPIQPMDLSCASHLAHRAQILSTTAFK